MGPFVRLTLEKTTLTPETRILKARDFQVFEQAEQVLADAKREAQAILSQAEQEYEAQKARGYEAGRNDAQIEAAEQMLEAAERAVNYFAQVEHKVAAVVMTAVRKVLGEFDDEELTIRIVRNALNTVRTQQQVTLRVNPSQEEHARRRLSEIMQGYSGIGYLELIADHRLQAGGCILETELGVVDASLDVQLQALEKAMASKLDKNRA